MIFGTVKVWKPENGWGFIKGDDGEDYFINVSNIRKGQVLKNGVRIKFDVFEGQRGPEAINASLS